MPEPEIDSRATQTILVRFDPTTAAQIYRRKERPANRRRQKFVAFLGREGPGELFQIMQTVPETTPGDRPASPAQHGAVEEFYGMRLPEDAGHRAAHRLLCARDYAIVLASSLSFSAQRRILLTRFIAAYLVHEPSLAEGVRRWCDGFDRGRDIRSGIAHDPAYRKGKAFAEKLILDLRGAGAEIFG